MGLSIIIPCRNEEENLHITIKEIEDFLNDKITNYEIILINDFSTDNTLDLAKKISRDKKFIKVFNNINIGLGGAINAGIRNSTKTYCVIVMADLSDSPNDIVKYYNEIQEKQVDAVLGSRFMKQSRVIDYPIKKLVLNRIFNYLVKLLFWKNYNDYTNAFKIYKTSVLNEIKPIVSENFNIFLELPLKIIIRNYNYTVIPIDWKNRKAGEAKFKFKELGSKYLFTLLYCFFEKLLLDKKVNK